ncbi:MAG: ABC transporter permease [Lachnospiraceae bacterium]|nr:ABC transporter permease [Lachnospiraceae bacterium]
MDLLNKLTIKNLKLNKKRTIVTVVGIILSVALITSVASLYVSAVNSMINYEKTDGGNYHVAYMEMPVSEIDNIKENRDVEQVSIIKNVGYAMIGSKNEDKPYAFIRALDAESMENLVNTLEEGRWPEKDDEIVIPTHLKTNGRIDLKIGDKITLDVGKRVDDAGNELSAMDAGNCGEEYDFDGKLHEKIIDTTKKTYKIVGRMKRPSYAIEQYYSPGFSFIVLDNNVKTEKVDIYVRYNKLDNETLYRNIANTLGIDPDILVKFGNRDDEGFSEDDLEKYQKEMEKVKYEPEIHYSLIALETNPLGGDDMKGFLMISLVAVGIIIFTSVVCIKNSFDISITEKVKQYGMLKSVGATKKQIRKNVFREATILGIMGIPLGIISGVFASWVLIIITNALLIEQLTTDVELKLSISVLAIIVSLLLGAVTIYFSALGSARKAAKISPIDLIRNSGNIKIKSKKLKIPNFVNKFFGVGGVISYKNLKRNKKKYRTTVIAIIVSVSIFISLSEFMMLAFDEVHSQVEDNEYNLLLQITGKDGEDFELAKKTVTLDGISDYTLSRDIHYSLPIEKMSKKYLDYIDYDAADYSAEDVKVLSLGEEQYKKYIAKLGLKYEDVKDGAILIDYYKVDRYVDGKIENRYMETTAYDKGQTVELRDYYDESKYDTKKIKVVEKTSEKPFGFKNSQEILLVVSDELYDVMINEKGTDYIFSSCSVYYETENANKLQDEIEKMMVEDNYTLSNIDEQYRAEKNLITLAAIFLYGFITVISLIGITNIFNTITTNMELRKPEFAMLKSIGMTTSEFNRMIRLESLFMGVRSLLFGIPIGMGLAFVMYKFYTVEADTKFEIPLAATVASVVLVFVLIYVIMKYSLKKINKQNTIETIRNENI